MFAQIAMAAGSAGAVLSINATKIIAHVSPLHAGLMTEEINHSFDGGLYAELVQDRTFNGPVTATAGTLGSWSVIGTPGADSGVALELTRPLSDAVPISLRIDARSAAPDHRLGIANTGFWGMPIHAHTKYRLSFYAEVGTGFKGPLSASLESRDGSVTYASASVALSSATWKRYEVTLESAGDLVPTEDARLVLATEQPGTFWLTLVSLFPPTWNDHANGNRIDLMQKLADLHPKFLRFPGGSYLTGATIDSRFNWKATIGPLTTRAGHPNTWSGWASDGMGYLEFLTWCEDLGMEPVVGVYAGSSHHVDVEPGAALQPFVQDALDEIEYATGDISTRWGAMRARDGHPAPFKLTYVEIGNEDNKPSYDARFAQFFDAIRARYPAVQIIGSGTLWAFGTIYGHPQLKSRIPDVIDEHSYQTAAGNYKQVHHFDHYDRRGPKIFVGEWASLETRPELDSGKGVPTPNMLGALGDAAWMIGMERNSDLVIMQAYAPLFTNVNPGAHQWPTNLIGFDALSSYGSPSYYAQRMFNTQRGDLVLASAQAALAGFFHSVTRDSQSGTIYIKAVNTTNASRRVTIRIDHAPIIGPGGKVSVLAGAPDDTNSIQEPNKVVPVEQALGEIGARFTHDFPAHSVSVLQIPTH